MRDGILERAEQNAWFDDRPPQGPGRVDTFNPYKRMFNFDLQADTSVGTADLPPLFNQRVRQGMWLHWDGNNDLVDERNKSAAIGAGATEESLDLASLDRVAKWALDLKPPAFPAARIDRAKSPRARRSIRRPARSCHALDGSGRRTGDAVGRDRHRSGAPELVHGRAGGEDEHDRHRQAVEVLALPQDRRLRQHAARRCLVASAVSAQRIGADAAGAALPGERPRTFYRGYDVYDWQKVGFVAEGPDAERNGVRFDTSERGNSNAGHLYGRELPPADREALIEFLKTQ